MSDTARRRWLWVFVALSVGVLAWLLWRDVAAGRDSTSRERVNIALGLWSTRFLLAALAISPLSALFREPQLKRARRPLGLAAAGFAMVHAVQYLIYTRIWPSHLQILVIRPYLTIGVVAFALLLPLAATSTNAAVRKMGPRRWRGLHRLVYLALPLVLLHEALGWANLGEEAGVHVVLGVSLLGWRACGWARKLAQASTVPPRAAAV
jgi:sulfoxide reductase heme-binding subunit YedZ